MSAGIAPGLCAACTHHRVIRNRRGSEFHHCMRSRTDARFRKYPPIPVLRCAGFEPAGAGAPGPAVGRVTPPPVDNGEEGV